MFDTPNLTAAARDVSDWVRDTFDFGPVHSVRNLSGGGGSQLFKVNAGGPPRGGRALVVRRYFDAAWLAREPYLPANEAVMTEFARRAGLPVPEIFGRRLDLTPLVAMSWIPGSPIREPDVDRTTLRLAARIARTIHAIPAPEAPHGLRTYRPHYLETPVKVTVPPWTRNTAVWRRAIALYEAFKPGISQVLLHRDFHFGNLLFTERSLEGVIDWVTSCFGDSGADVAHMRWNLLLSHGEEAMIDFTDAYYRGQSGAHDPRWDVYALVGALPDMPCLTRAVAERVDAFMGRAGAALEVN